MEYDPDLGVDPKKWRRLSEPRQFEVVEEYHRSHRIRVPRARLHAAIHVIVETQVAMGDENPAARTLERLQAEGLSRHDAVHAIGSVLAGYILQVLQNRVSGKEVTSKYVEELERLSAEQWKKLRPED